MPEAAPKFSAYIFDFDGVLFDSAPECFELAWNAAQAPQWKEKVFFGKTADKKQFEKKFLENRFLVGPPWQFAVLLKLISEGELPLPTESFLKIAARLQSEFEEFTHDYFAERAVLAADRKKWHSYFGKHQPALDFFRGCFAEKKAMLLSTRNHESILALLNEAAQIPVKETQMLPRAGKKEKWELLQDFSRESGLQPSEVFFLDDYLPHLTPAKERGFSCFLAGWGYLSPDDKRLASEQGIGLLDLHRLKEWNKGE